MSKGYPIHALTLLSPTIITHFHTCLPVSKRAIPGDVSLWPELFPLFLLYSFAGGTQPSKVLSLSLEMPQPVVQLLLLAPQRSLPEELSRSSLTRSIFVPNVRRAPTVQLLITHL